MDRSKYNYNNWRVIVNETGSIYIDRIYMKEFVSIVGKNAVLDKDKLILDLCEKILYYKRKLNNKDIDYNGPME